MSQITTNAVTRSNVGDNTNIHHQLIAWISFKNISAYCTKTIIADVQPKPCSIVFSPLILIYFKMINFLFVHL